MLNIKNRLKNIQWSKKNMLIAALGILLLTTASIYIYKNMQKNNTSTTYLTTPVRRGNIEQTIGGSGSLQPVERYVLQSRTQGTVTEVMAAEGTAVKIGDPLLRISSDEIESQARSASLEWEIANYNLQDLLKPLSEENSTRRNAELKVEQYRIALEEKKLEKDKLILKAPFDGTVISTELQVGQRVNLNTLAVKFATTNQMEVAASFSDNDISVLAKGMECQIYVKGINENYTGKVKEIKYTGSAGSFEVIISLDKSGEKLYPGMQTYNTVIIAKDPDNDIFMYRQASGYLRYTESKDLVAEVSGTVAEIYRQSGEKVYKDTPLLRITNDEIDRQVKSAENQLAIAEDELRKILSPDETTIKQQQLRVEQSYQKVLSARDKLDRLTVLSPIDGIVAEIAVTPGDELTADVSKQLVVVSNFSRNTMKISVDELDINKLKFGQKASVTIGALPGVVLEGEVVGIAQEGTTSDGVTKYPVTLEVGYAEGIKSGMTATATITLQSKENVIRIPSEALITSNGRSQVRVKVNDNIQVKPVTVGINTGRWVEIINGLEEGEQLVTAIVEGTQQTQLPNIRVPVNPGAPGGQGGQGGVRFNPQQGR